MPPPHDGAAGEALRNLRRWVIVAGVWAVAATAIALIALLDTSGSEAQKEADDAAGRAAETERKLVGRIDALKARLDELASADDVSNLEERLRRAEQDASQATDAARDGKSKTGDLEDRVKELEEDAGASPADRPGAIGGADQP